MLRARSAVLATTVAVALSAAAAGPVDAGGDREAASHWALTQVGAPQAWARTTGAGVRIGIVDTGVDLASEDLAGKVVAATSCLGAAGTPARCSGSGQDDDGHGTHVAGIAAALRGNGVGIAGMAPDAELVVAKAITRTGVGTVGDVVAGIKWVVDRGARVVNLSLDSPAMTFAGVKASAIREGLDYAWTRGAVPVLSAGSPRRLGVGLGARSDRDLNAVVVGATGPDGRMAPGSPGTGGARLAVLAPGDEGGTSVAAAYTSGALALLLAQGYNALGAVERLLLTADDTVLCGESSPSCYGRIDVGAATSGPVQHSSR